MNGRQQQALSCQRLTLRPWFILNDSEAQRLAGGALSFGFFPVLQFGSGRVYTETKTSRQFFAKHLISLGPPDTDRLT